MAYARPEPLGKHLLDAFECGEPALDDWLKRYARGAHASGSARVFVTTLEDGETVVGYYALAAARALKGQPRARPVPAILLARLAVDRKHQGAGLGRSLLQDVLLRCVETAEAIGARVLLAHAKHDAAKSWYMQLGFEESPTDSLHLLMLLEDVRALLQQRGNGVTGPISATLSAMSESLRVTIVYERGEDGWVVASIPEVPGAHSQGRSREEARANVIDALRGILELRFGEHPAVATAADSEPLELVIGA